MNTVLMNDDQCWQAVLSREDSPAAPFLYGVRSTKIYCRPSCPARRPRREQVQFFLTPDAAEDAGFRACRRCRPREADAVTESMRNVCRYIEAHGDAALDLAALSALAGLSPSHFQRTFRRRVGVTPRQYAAACRLGEFKSRLQGGEAVTSAIIETGYGSTSRVYERTPLGMTPTAYRRGGEKMSVAYTLADTPLGQMLVAATAQGICAISLGDSDESLEAALRREYPAAQIARDDAGLAMWVETLVRHLHGAQPHLDLPLDIRRRRFSGGFGRSFNPSPTVRRDPTPRLPPQLAVQLRRGPSRRRARQTQWR